MAASVSSAGRLLFRFSDGGGGGAMSPPFLRSRIDDGSVGASRIDRGPTGTDDAPVCIDASCEGFHTAPPPLAASRLFCASSTSFRRFSSAIRSRSAFGMNLGFAAAASFSRLALRISSMLGGCLRDGAAAFIVSRVLGLPWLRASCTLRGKVDSNPSVAQRRELICRHAKATPDHVPGQSISRQAILMPCFLLDFYTAASYLNIVLEHTRRKASLDHDQPACLSSPRDYSQCCTQRF